LKELSPDAVLHIDAAQAPLWVSCQFSSVGADLLTLDAGKCCGPKGVGVLVRKNGVELAPTIHGGGQENGLRPGTENVAGIVGAAVALEWAQGGWRARATHARTIRDQAIAHILSEIPTAVLNGPPNPEVRPPGKEKTPRSDLGEKYDDRVANNINISIPGLDTEFATVVLDKHGFAVSTKSACNGAGGGASAVVLATTGDISRATSTLRITLGLDTTLAQLKSLTAMLKVHVEQMECFNKQ